MIQALLRLPNQLLGNSYQVLRLFFVFYVILHRDLSFFFVLFSAASLNLRDAVVDFNFRNIALRAVSTLSFQDLICHRVVMLINIRHCNFNKKMQQDLTMTVE